MHGFKVALLVLAASAAVPVFSVPISARNVGDWTIPHEELPNLNLIPENERYYHLISRSNANLTLADVITLSAMLPRAADLATEMQARGWLDDLNGLLQTNTAGSARRVTPDRLAARDNVDNFVAALLSQRDLSPEYQMQSRSFLSNVFQVLEGFIRRDVTDDQLGARDGINDFITLLNNRDLGGEHEIQARSFLSNVFQVLEGFIRRDVTDDQLGARDGIDDFMTLLNNRDLGGEHEIQARGIFSNLFQVLEGYLRRDVTDDQLSARDSIEDFIALLNNRDLGGEHEIRRDVTPDQVAARDAVDDLLQSRDATPTPEQVFKLAMLMSRSFDDLD